MTNHNPRLMACEEATWLAALIDGEGCFITIQGRTILCKVEMLNNPIILKCFQITRCGTVNKRVKNGKRFWMWQLTATYGKPIIEQVFPYLIEKKEQAEIFIRWPAGAQRYRVPAYILTEREKLVSRIKYLNHSEHQHQPNYEYVPKQYCTMQGTL